MKMPRRRVLASSHQEIMTLLQESPGLTLQQLAIILNRPLHQIRSEAEMLVQVDKLDWQQEPYKQGGGRPARQYFIKADGKMDDPTVVYERNRNIKPASAGWPVFKDAIINNDSVPMEKYVQAWVMGGFEPKRLTAAADTLYRTMLRLMSMKVAMLEGETEFPENMLPQMQLDLIAAQRVVDNLASLIRQLLRHDVFSNESLALTTLPPEVDQDMVNAWWNAFSTRLNQIVNEPTA